MILLDTDIMIDLLRGFPPAIKWLGTIGDEELILPGFVVMELIQGCKNKSEQRKVEKTLAGFFIDWPSYDSCDKALNVFSRVRLRHTAWG